jgi:hypothetical protein
MNNSQSTVVLTLPKDIMRGIDAGVVQIKRKWDSCWKDHTHETLNGVIEELDHDSHFRITPGCDMPPNAQDQTAGASDASQA